RWVGIIPYELARQGKDEFTDADYVALAKDMEAFWAWYQGIKPGWELKDCKPFGENWVKWRGISTPAKPELVDDPDYPGKKIDPHKLKARQVQDELYEAEYGRKRSK